MTTFKKGDIVRHHKSHITNYLVLATPSCPFRIESTNVGAYAYKDLVNGTIWARPATEMEDGRFSLVYGSTREAIEASFQMTVYHTDILAAILFALLACALCLWMERPMKRRK